MAKKVRKLIWLTEGDKEDIIRMIGEGKPYKEIAEYIGCSYATISHWAMKTGNQKWDRSTKEEISEVLKYHEDHPVKEIAEMTGVSVEAVCGIIARKYRKEKKA